jgi:RNA polymerase sigma-70 factor (ECF subfamily)
MVAERTGYLAERAASGDEQAFAELVRACSRTLYQAARAILRSDQDAQDCVQEAILTGWKSLPKLRERRYFTTWLTRITINTAINMTRKRRPNTPLLIDLPARGDRSEERLDIRRAIESLDEKTRLCTVLFYFEDMPIAEIARAVGIRECTVRTRLFRARERLRSVLEGYDHE